MSRIGRLPVEIPAGTEVRVGPDGATVTVQGPRGQLTRTLPGVRVRVEGARAVVEAARTDRQAGAFHGLGRALLANMVKGIAEGHKRTLLITGTGYRAELAGQTLKLTLGHSHPIEYELPAGVEAKVEDRGTRIELVAADKELLGHTAAKIRGFRPPEPYKGKGVRYADEVIIRKAGKTGK